MSMTNNFEALTPLEEEDPNDGGLGDALIAGYGDHRSTLISGKGQKMATLAVVVVAVWIKYKSRFKVSRRVYYFSYVEWGIQANIYSTGTTNQFLQLSYSAYNITSVIRKEIVLFL